MGVVIEFALSLKKALDSVESALLPPSFTEESPAYTPVRSQRGLLLDDPTVGPGERLQATRPPSELPQAPASTQDSSCLPCEQALVAAATDHCPTSPLCAGGSLWCSPTENHEAIHPSSQPYSHPPRPCLTILDTSRCRDPRCVHPGGSSSSSHSWLCTAWPRPSQTASPPWQEVSSTCALPAGHRVGRGKCAHHDYRVTLAQSLTLPSFFSIGLKCTKLGLGSSYVNSECTSLA